MCRKTMETTSEMSKTDFLQQTTKHECKFFSLYTKDNEIFKPQRPLRKSAIRKQRRRDLKRAKLAKLAGFFLMKPMPEKRKKLSVCPPDGAMAPANTTQYLMSKVYEDMQLDFVPPVLHKTDVLKYSDCLSPRSMETLPDSDFEDCLEFQQRNFEEAFGLV